MTAAEDAVARALSAGAHYGFQVRPGTQFMTRNELDPDAYRTFHIAAPRASHYRAATCEEAGCLPYRNGWRVHVDILNEAQKHAIISSSYKFRQTDHGPGETFWDFEPGQPCFHADEHTVPVGRPALFLLRDGDHRWSQVRHQFRSPEAFRDASAEHQQTIADAIQKG
jgi:hypothetical protein